MTLMETLPPMLEETSPSVDLKAALLARVLELFDRDGLPYCILHGYDNYPDRVDSDVDLLVPSEAVPRRLGELLRNAERQLGARIVQWFADRAQFIVLCATGDDGVPVMLQLHVSCDYEVSDRLIYSGNDVLRTRRRHERDFWVPAANVEFVCVLINRIVKGKLESHHTEQLSKLWMQNREQCAHEMFRFFNAGAARMIADAAEANDWGMVQDRMRELRKEFLRLSVMRQPTSYATRVLGSQGRRVVRWLKPQSGLHVVFLGPDGVGKSTTIEAVRERVADAFLCVKYQTFASSILPNKPKASPHALPPRSKFASFLKAGWWELCYTLGYLKSVHPTRCRGGLAINHRYLIDAIVDPKRYRYSGPQELLWAIWATAFKPDLLIFLDAPADVIQARKQETTPEETARQVEAYRAMAGRLPNAKLVDTSVNREETVQRVTEIILGTMANRIARRLKSR